MGVSYDVFAAAFLDKVEEYKFIQLDIDDRIQTVDRYMKRACAQFNKVCKYDLVNGDDGARELLADIPDEDIDEIVDIVSEGMLVQWMKPYVYKQENYENIINTTDYSGFSPAELLNRITAAYNVCKKDFKNMIKNYSYDHGDLSDLHI